MKSNIYIFLFIACFIALLNSCKKQEPLLAESPKVVNLEITGNTSKDLEFIYNDSVIVTVAVTGDQFSRIIKVAVRGNGDEIKIREKGSTNIIATRPVKPAPFDQSFTIYYEGGKIYDQVITYLVKGYAMSGELEFLLDGNVITSGSTAINQTFTFPINQNDTREIQVRKKDETDILITKTLTASPSTGQALKFFFDGTSMVDNVQLTPPTNPDNMAINAQFKSTVTPPLPVFIPGDLDLVFFIRNTSNNTITKTSPEIRIPLSSDGSFTAFELPPLPGGNYEYRFDIYQRGTNTTPYDASASPVKILKANEGRFGTAITFTAGDSKLFLINDNIQIGRTPAPIHYIPSGRITDLSQYFQ